MDWTKTQEEFVVHCKQMKMEGMGEFLEMALHLLTDEELAELIQFKTERDKTNNPPMLHEWMDKIVEAMVQAIRAKRARSGPSREC